jgi:hypothetical protein
MKPIETPDRQPSKADTADFSVERRPRNNVQDSASGSDETEDGLDETSEAVRHAAEDLPRGAKPVGPMETIPVFDRGSLPPKA